MEFLRNYKIPFLSLVFVFVGLFLYSKIFGPIPFEVNNINTNKTDLFKTTGSGAETAVPNTAMVDLGVTSRGATVDAAKNKTNEIANKITSDLKSSGIKENEIKTLDYSINPIYDQNQNINGYEVNQTLELKVTPIEKANNAIDLATKDGANQVNRVNFILDEKTSSDLKNKALNEAVADAKSKAKALADAAGIKLGKVINVEQNEESPMPVALSQGALLQKGTGDNTSLNPGETKVKVTVTLTFETL